MQNVKMFYFYPEANKSVVGFQAQMNTSDSCPLRTVALLAGISMLTSISPESPPPELAKEYIIYFLTSMRHNIKI
jgi:hypothetical protein